MLGWTLPPLFLLPQGVSGLEDKLNPSYYYYMPLYFEGVKGAYGNSLIVSNEDLRVEWHDETVAQM